MRNRSAMAIVLTLAVLASPLMVTQAPAQAQVFHRYSIIYDETSSANDYRGVATTRGDVAMILSTPAGCDQPYSGWPVYQTQWVLITLDGQNWVEIGTGHGCNNVMYWFGGYGFGGTWNPLYTIRIDGQYQNHQFLIRSDSFSNWQLAIDVTSMTSVQWSAQGIYVQAGLESYDAFVGLGTIPVWSLTRFNGVGPGMLSAFPWGATMVIDTPVMCGVRVSNDFIRVGQNTPSC